MLKIPAYLDALATRKDRSVKFVFESQELGAEEGAAAFALRQQFGWLIFSANSIDERAVPEEPAPTYDDERSPSQRFRSVLFLRWQRLKKDGKYSGDFNTYYRGRMETLIEQEKDLL